MKTTFLDLYSEYPKQIQIISKQIPLSSWTIAPLDEDEQKYYHFSYTRWLFTFKIKCKMRKTTEEEINEFISQRGYRADEYNFQHQIDEEANINWYDNVNSHHLTIMISYSFARDKHFNIKLLHLDDCNFNYNIPLTKVNEVRSFIEKNYKQGQDVIESYLRSLTV